jgi:hypothetical protein
LAHQAFDLKVGLDLIISSHGRLGSRTRGRSSLSPADKQSRHEMGTCHEAHDRHASTGSIVCHRTCSLPLTNDQVIALHAANTALKSQGCGTGRAQNCGP